jgi:Ser/Thr protein kinase RdoA (MazF antagonist)
MSISFPVGPRAELSVPLIQTIARCYGLSSITSYTDIGGAYNLNIRLDTARTTYVARVYRPWITHERLTAVQAAKHQLHAAHVPVVLPLPTTTGATFIEYEQRLIEVEPFVEHDSAAESWQSYRSAFTFLSQLHTVLAEHLAIGNFPPPVVENYSQPLILLQWIEHTKQHIQQADHPQRAVALGICDTAFQLLQPINAWWQHNAYQLPQQVIHGDYGIGNVLMRKEQVVALVDLEFLAVHERVFDLAYTLYWMMHRVESKTGYEHRSWHRIEEMVTRYNNTNSRPLTDAEWQALPLEMVRVPLHWIGEAGFLPNPTEAVLSRAEQVALAHWMAHHPDAII